MTMPGAKVEDTGPRKADDTEGQKMTKTLSRLILLAGLVLSGSFVIFQCGDPPTAAPDQYMGSLRVAALDTLTIDSISIDLDDMRIGRFRNPTLLNDVVAGIHKVLVSSTPAVTASRTVEILRGRRTDLFIQLQSSGPYVGGTAPLFTARAINGDTIAIAKLKGKAVFLAFFEHT